MLELYHHGSSVCAAKVRLVLAEKSLDWTPHYIDILRGEQFDPAYLKLNPKAVVPTLIHDGAAIRESTLICEYLDDAFPQSPLKPADALGRVRMRAFTKLVDEKIHEMCAVLTFAASHRFTIMQMSPAAVDDFIARTPEPEKRVRKREWIDKGLQSVEAVRAVKVHSQMLDEMEMALAGGPYLVGETYSLADIGLTPYVNRLHMLGMLEGWTANRPRVRAWFDRMRARANFGPAVDSWLPESLATDLRTNGARAWPEVERILTAG